MTEIMKLYITLILCVSSIYHDYITSDCLIQLEECGGKGSHIVDLLKKKNCNYILLS